MRREGREKGIGRNGASYSVGNYYTSESKFRQCVFILQVLLRWA